VTDPMTPEQLHAARLITQHGKGVPWPTIRKSLEDVAGWGDLAPEQQARMVADIDRLIGLAEITVSWPADTTPEGDA